QERGVLADVDVREWRGAPQRAPVDQRSAGQPVAREVRPLVEPGLSGDEVVVEELARTAHICASPQQRLNLRAQATWRHPVVVIPVRDELAARYLAGDVAFGADGGPLVEAEIPNSIVAGYQVRDAVVSVVDNHQLTRGVVLLEEIANRLANERPAVARGHDARDQRTTQRYFATHPDSRLLNPRRTGMPI